MNDCVIKTIKVIIPNKPCVNIVPVEKLKTSVVNAAVEITSGGTNDYDALTNKPMINGNILQSGNNTSASLDIIEDKTFACTQRTPASVWIIEHNLNKFPSVTVADSADSVVIGDIQYIDVNNLTITFSAPFSGMAYLN